ncbi:hypothetical protein DES47_104224 [Roseateles toxinivorans]|uniref:Uncharacterized protein n=1 Tax=Roseateles toxinivorans TaxID=270368 RepID=A0A4R6QL44_9BURK|nr:hypothetical protein DES47_104224 [Roseateles toxinivorans]
MRKILKSLAPQALLDRYFADLRVFVWPLDKLS